MKLSKNINVQTFIEILETTDQDEYEIVIEIRQIILDTFQNVEEKIMYGGIVFFYETEMFCGIFVYKNHISVEFGKGSTFNDPNNLLEGKGKFRRHLKIMQKKDILSKQVSFFVKQAV